MKVYDLINILEENPNCFLCTALLLNQAMDSGKYPAYLSDFYLSNINPCNKEVLILGFYYDTPDYIIDKYTASHFIDQLRRSLMTEDYQRDVWCTISNPEFSITYPDIYFAQSKVNSMKLMEAADNRCKLFVDYHQEPVCV